MPLPFPRARGVAIVGALIAGLASPLVAQNRGTMLRVDGRANANPSIAASGQFVAIAWSAATISSMDVFAALSRDGGRTFSAPTRVNDVEGEARVNSELPPRVALVSAKKAGDAPDVVVVWTAKGATGTKLLTARSSDGARTFSPARAVPGGDAAGSRGWESVAVGGDGRVGVLWLDHRDAAAMPMQHHDTAKSKTADAPKPDPTERAKLSKLYFATLGGDAGKPIASGVCYCCKTSLVASGDAFYGVWRNVYAGSQRDIAFTASQDGGRTFSAPVRVSDDGWHIDGCPENGPAIAVRDSRIQVVWPTPPDGKSETPLAIFYAASSDGGKTFAPRLRVSSRGPAAHAQILATRDGGSIIAWDEIIEGTRRLAAVRGRASGVNAISFEPIALPDANAERGWPVLAQTSSNLLLASMRGDGTESAISVIRLSLGAR